MYTTFTYTTKMSVWSTREGVRSYLKTLPLLVTYERWYGPVLRCDILRMTDAAEVTIDIDDTNRELRFMSRQRGAIESMLDDLGIDVNNRGQVEETRIHPMRRSK